jgi:hypothetical protein
MTVCPRSLALPLILFSCILLAVSCSSLPKTTSDEYAEMQRQKDRTAIPDAGSVRDVSVSQIGGWSQGHKMPTAGKSRDDWSKSDRDYVYHQEQQAVRVIGYLLQATPQPDGDIHLYLVDSMDQPIGKAMIAELSPHFRSVQSWDSTKVQQHVHSQVRVTGWLLWDEEHGVGADRMTQWEIHPVTQFEVLDAGNWHPI